MNVSSLLPLLSYSLLFPWFSVIFFFPYLFSSSFSLIYFHLLFPLFIFIFFVPYLSSSSFSLIYLHLPLCFTTGLMFVFLFLFLIIFILHLILMILVFVLSSSFFLFLPLISSFCSSYFFSFFLFILPSLFHLLSPSFLLPNLFFHISISSLYSFIASSSHLCSLPASVPPNTEMIFIKVTYHWPPATQSTHPWGWPRSSISSFAFPKPLIPTS